ncbi:hypothetical protein ABZT04_10880 [Streptomyces sp. NPDC005492]|uniref:hypothetical protein n=1 Tax=Streptomyces sp. NPDC005492 TaxID=3156883 RepID=UPI0033B6F20C
MIYPRRGPFFWLILSIVLYTIAVAPRATAHFIRDTLHAVLQFYTSLGIFLSSLK